MLTDSDSEGRLLASSRIGREGFRAMRKSAVHATLSPKTSGHNWSFSSRNSVVPLSRWSLPQSERNAERPTGEPGVALLAGVRGENSPRLPYLLEPGKILRWCENM